jgi:hypothetical protein
MAQNPLTTGIGLQKEIVIQAPAWKLWFAVAGEEGLTLGGRLPKWPLKKPAANIVSEPDAADLVS